MQPSRRLHLLQFGFEAHDAIADHAAVGLDLGLAGSAEEAEAAALAFEVGPRPHQPAALILEVRELDLKRAFLRFGATAENFEDQAGAVEHLGAPGLLEIALLHRRQRAIHHHEIDVVRGDEADDLLDLALAEIGRRPDLASAARSAHRQRSDRWRAQARAPRRDARRYREHGRRQASRRCRRAPLPQIRSDHQHAAGFASCPTRSVGVPSSCSRFQSGCSHVALSSLPSNSWIGAPGMMVEIACL